MLQQPLAPPTQPRGAGPVRRGRIQKRSSGLPRVDKDGDLDMDAAGGTRQGRGAGERGNTQAQHSRGGAASGAGRQGRGSRMPRPGLNHDTMQRAVLRSMGITSEEHLPPGFKHTGRPTRQNGKSLIRERDSNIREIAQVIIRGFRDSKVAAKPDGGMKDLLIFLERKAFTSDTAAGDMVRIKKSRVDGDALIISVCTPDVPKITRLNNYIFAGATLAIEPYHGESINQKNDAHPGTTNAVSQTLKGVLCRRYDPNLKLLDLSVLGEDADLVNLGMFSTPSVQSKLFPALMKICDTIFQTAQEKADGVLSVVLAGNALNTITSVTTLAHTFPALKNLDLSNNQLKSLSAIEAWRWKFRYLDQLILSGNPLETELPSYKDDLLKWYPTLRTLNGITIRSSEEIKAASQSKVISIPVFGPNFHDEGGIGEAFVKHFFPGYDSDRSAILNLFYDTQSTFSLSINVSAPRGPDAEQRTPPNWDSYIKRSRNLVKVNHITAKLNRIYTGRDMIQQCWQSIPSTRHPDLITDSHKWCIECNSIPGLPDTTGQSPGGVGGLIITVHGEFSEVDVSTGQLTHKRSFDRTLVLGPGVVVGTVRVICDTLMLRAWGGSEAWMPTIVNPIPSIPLPAALPIEQQQLFSIIAPSGIGVPAPGKTDEELQKELLQIELSKRTGMILEWSHQCLSESGWCLDGALGSFEKAKGAIPEYAFIGYQAPT